jgi:glycosyltransferase involved in cell wall biosynthesis
MRDPVTSVIIPSRNRPGQIACCLDALAAQIVEPGSFEVIVVDDGSEPRLELDPTRWADAFPLTVIHQHNTGPAGARNRGVDAAKGEFLAFTDDDCLPSPTWLAELVTALRDQPDAMVGGSTLNGLVDNAFSETSQLIIEMVYVHFNRDPANAYFFASNNIACCRDRYLASGGFDTGFPGAAAEDREICDRWRMQGRPLVWQKSAVIEHRHRQTLLSFSRLHFRYGQGAFIYQQMRRLRGSGTMADDLGFHRSLPSLAAKSLARHPPLWRLAIGTNLLLWQLVNACGFMYEWAFGPTPRENAGKKSENRAG